MTEPIARVEGEFAVVHIGYEEDGNQTWELRIKDVAAFTMFQDAVDSLEFLADTINAAVKSLESERYELRERVKELEDELKRAEACRDHNSSLAKLFRDERDAICVENKALRANVAALRAEKAKT